MKGINYYHESMGYIQRDYNQMDSDIKLIAQKYKAIKIYHNPFKPDDIIHTTNAAKIAKKYKLFIIWVENNDTEQLTEENWQNYIDIVYQDAFIAKRLNVDEFSIGNEISIHNDNSSGFDDINLPLKIKMLADKVNPTGLTIGYQEGWWKKDIWRAIGLGSLYKIWFTLYENDIDFEKHARDIYAKFGKNAEIGEWSTQSTFFESATDEIDWAQQLSSRQKILDILNLDHYIFCFRDTGVDNNDKGFGLVKNTIYQPRLIWHLLP